MTNLWYFCGRVAFWVSWPLLFCYLRFTRRTRIIVRCGDEILAVKGWLSAGDWGLPGGGLHRGEEPAKGAARELKEETGIDVNATELQLLFENMVHDKRGFKYKIFVYLLNLETKPKLTKQKLEIIDLDWMDWQKLCDHNSIDAQVRDQLTALYND